MSELTLKDVLEINNTKELFIQYGRFCERHGIKDTSDINNYEDYLNYGGIDWENEDNLEKDKKYYIEIVIKHQIINFLQGLTSYKYNVILVDCKYPITIEDDLEYWLYELLENVSYIVKQGDTLNIIYNDRTKVRLIGYDCISDVEIFTRKFLIGKCECGLIVKDNPYQEEITNEQIKNTEDYYCKCRDIYKIELVEEDYDMNWDAIRVYYKLKNGQSKTEIWQPI